jgi:hypothetical protein
MRAKEYNRIFLFTKGLIQVRTYLYSLSLLLFSFSATANQSLSLPLESGDEISINIYHSTFGVSKKPLLIWFTEGYVSRKPFKQLITRFNDAGYEFWQVDLL